MPKQKWLCRNCSEAKHSSSTKSFSLDISQYKTGEAKRGADFSVGAALCLFLLLVLVILVSTLSVSGNAAVPPALPLVLVVLIFAGALLFQNRASIRGFRTWLLLFFLIRLLISIWYYYQFWDKGYQLFLLGQNNYDQYRYDDSALQVMRVGWERARISVDYFGIVAYYSLIYQLFGYNPLFGVLVNTLLGGLTALLVFWYAKHITSARVATISAILALVVPDLILYGGQLMKEMLVMFAFYAALIAWMRFETSGKLWGLVIFVGAIYVLMETRVAYVLILLSSVAIFVVFNWRRMARRTVYLILIGLAMVGLATAGGSNYVRGRNILTPQFWLERRAALDVSSVGQILAERTSQDVSIGLSTAVQPTNPATYIFIPFRVATFYLIPPFWIWNSAPDFFPFLELTAIMTWVCLPAVGWGLWRSVREPKGYYLWVPFVIGTLVMSVGTPFVDHRLKLTFMPMFFMLALVGFEQFRIWRQLYVPYLVLVGLVAGGYYFVKIGGLG